MPFLKIFDIPESKTQVALWHIAEDEAFFKSKLSFSNVESSEIARLSPRRRLERLAGICLVQTMTDFHYQIVKDAAGKPHLESRDSTNAPPMSLSISHSGEWAAAIVSKRLVGIDIQLMSPKLENMAWRIMNEDKFTSLDTEHRLEHLHVYWGAKESLYKAFGKRELHFKNNLIVTPFDFSTIKPPSAVENFDMTFDAPITEGVVSKEDFYKTFNIHARKIGQYVLVFAIEK